MSFDENTPDNILGQEFLTWLWYRSDSNPQAFTDTDGTPFSVSLEQRITVEGGQGEERGFFHGQFPLLMFYGPIVARGGEKSI